MRKRITRKTERVSENPVTHAIEVVALDAVQLALERAVASVDREMCKLTAPADRERLARRLIERVQAMTRSDSQDSGEAT